MVNNNNINLDQPYYDLINHPRDERYFNDVSDKIWDSILVLQGAYDGLDPGLTNDQKFDRIKNLFEKMPITEEILQLPDDLIKRDIFAKFSAFFYKSFHMLSSEERKDLFKFFPEMKVNFEKIIQHKIDKNLEYAKLGLYGTRSREDLEKVYHLSRDQQIINPRVMKTFMSLPEVMPQTLYTNNFPAVDEGEQQRKGLIRRSLDTLYHQLVKPHNVLPYPFLKLKDGESIPLDYAPERYNVYHPLLARNVPQADPQLERINQVGALPDNARENRYLRPVDYNEQNPRYRQNRMGRDYPRNIPPNPNIPPIPANNENLINL